MVTWVWYGGSLHRVMRCNTTYPDAHPWVVRLMPQIVLSPFCGENVDCATCHPRSHVLRMHIACARGVAGRAEAMDQGRTGSVPPDTLHTSPIPAASSHRTPTFNLLELVNGVRWLAGGWIAQVTLILAAYGEQVIEPRERTRCRLTVLEQILGSG